MYSTGDVSGKGQREGEGPSEGCKRPAPRGPNVVCGEMHAADRIYMLIYSLIEKTRELQFPPKPKELDSTCLIG